MQTAFSYLEPLPQLSPEPALSPQHPAALSIASSHFLTGAELSYSEMHSLLELARLLKSLRSPGKCRRQLEGFQIALMFEKPSLRTRVSFTVAAQELGANPIEILAANTKHEEPEDTVRVLAGYCHTVMARTMKHSTLERMAKVSPIPIINGLSDLHHPCQILADLLTLLEKYQHLDGLEVAYIGDGNNILHSLLLMAPIVGVKIRYACPKKYGPNAGILAEAKLRHRKMIKACATPQEAVLGAHAVYTDVWTSMGFEAEAAAREAAFAGYQVNEALMAKALPGAIVMHCLPMLRGKEISETLPENPCSVIFQQSENRLHAQKALLMGMLPKKVGAHE